MHIYVGVHVVIPAVYIIDRLDTPPPPSMMSKYLSNHYPSLIVHHNKKKRRSVAREDTIESGMFSIKCCTSWCVCDKEDEKYHLVILLLLLLGKQKQK